MTDAARRVALVPVNLLLLARELRFPEGAVIESVSAADPHRPDLIYLRVSSPDFREVRPGEFLPERQLTMFSTGETSQFR
jgi:hypothetical protein